MDNGLGGLGSARLGYLSNHHYFIFRYIILCKHLIHLLEYIKFWSLWLLLLSLSPVSTERMLVTWRFQVPVTLGRIWYE